MQARRLSVGALEAAPLGVLIACALANAWRLHGSIAASDWLALAVLSTLLLAVLVGSGAAMRTSRLATTGIAALVALAVWATVTLAWSPAPSLARDEGLLTLWYAIAAAIAALSVRSPEGRIAALWVVTVGIGGLALVTALELRFGANPVGRYFEGRLSFPITYANAQAGMFVLGFWPAVVLAARRSAPLVARGGALCAATGCLGAAAIAQSKGATLGLAVSLVAVTVVSPARLRILVPALLALVAVAATFVPLTDPFRVSAAAEAGAIRHTGSTLLVLIAVMGALGIAYAACDRRLSLSPRSRRRVGQAALALFLVAVVAGVAAAAVAIGNPRTFVVDKWNAFSSYHGQEASTHLLTLGSNRYDFWRVDAHEFVRHPVAGIGARGFAAAYLVEGRSPETPARGHSVVMDALAEQGVIGFVLLAIGVGALLVAAAAGARTRLAPALAAFPAGIAWLVQACVDWTWTFPALGLPAFALLGLGAAAVDGRRLSGRAVPVLATAAVVVAVLVVAPPWISARLTEQALREGSTAPLAWARRLDPVSTAPLVAESQVAPTIDARLAALREAVRKEPRSLTIRYLLAATELGAGEKRAARDDLRVALALKPGDGAVRALLREAAR